MVRPGKVPVETAKAAVGPLIATVGDEGQTRVRQRHIITAPLAGRMERITLNVGDTVTPGMAVVRLAPLPLDARSRQQAEAALAAARDLEQMSVAEASQARTALEQARRDRQRADRLVPSGGIAPAEAERLQGLERTRQREVDAADARARAARHDIESAESALLAAGSTAGRQTLTLDCPVGGRVLAIPEASERTVQAGEPLLEVGDPSDLEIVVDLLSTDAVKVVAGQPMLLSGWGGDTTVAGWVRRVEPSGFTKVSALGVEEQRVNVIGDFVRPPARLGDRYRLDVRIILWQGDSVLKVPASALFRRGERWSTFVVEGGRAHERNVTVGHESATETEVTAGLKLGDVVVRHPTDRIREGARVEVQP